MNGSCHKIVIPEPSAAEIERQVRWEVHATNQAVKKYRQTQHKAALADSNVGQRIGTDILSPELIGDITVGLAKATEYKTANTLVPLLSVTPEKLAVLGVRGALTAVGRKEDFKRVRLGKCDI